MIEPLGNLRFFALARPNLGYPDAGAKPTPRGYSDAATMHSHYDTATR